MRSIKLSASVVSNSLVLILVGFISFSLPAQNNLSFSGNASASSQIENYPASNALDGDKETSWRSEAEDRKAWIVVRFPGATEVKGLEIRLGATNASQEWQLQYLLNGEWRKIMDISLEAMGEFKADLPKPLLTDRVRLQAMDNKEMDISAFVLIGQSYEDESVGEVKKVLVNQSGYNLNRPKGFTVPGIPDKTPFSIYNINDRNTVAYKGLLKGEKGDFHDFNPETDQEFVVRVGEEESFPFRIGPYWLERVTYRLMVDFMMGARHYVGDVTEMRPLSFAWRDGDFFNWSMQSLVAMYLSNPIAYQRMEVTGKYVENATYPEEYKGRWGALEPFPAHTPDLVQLIHWDADVKVSQKLDHEMQKAELAHFLYAWPYLSEWLPRQNFDKVYEFAKEVWEKSSVSEHATSQYDQSPEHNLLALKTQMGTTKGEMPPGFSVIPNLMMYEVGQREGDPNADKYFEAAFKQMEWMIAHLDWQDPMSTKGQRMSEHITMRAFAYFFHEFPDKHPTGLREKVKEWAEIMVERSDNLWDFRKYDKDEWTPPGWNETGNILGFPASVFAALSVIKEENEVLADRLETIAWAHMENAFGRNPTGRHFSYKGPEEIKGVDLGWYSRHKGGIGLLDELPFVFDGSPKNFHYPNHPEVGNLGWTEGWVQFNTAFNTSMAYMANYYTHVEMGQEGDALKVRLKAPLHADIVGEGPIQITLSSDNGDAIPVSLTQMTPYSLVFEGDLKIENDILSSNGKTITWKKGESLRISYGYGFMEKSANIQKE